MWFAYCCFPSRSNSIKSNTETCYGISERGTSFAVSSKVPLNIYLGIFGSHPTPKYINLNISSYFRMSAIFAIFEYVMSDSMPSKVIKNDFVYYRVVFWKIAIYM